MPRFEDTDIADMNISIKYPAAKTLLSPLNFKKKESVRNSKFYDQIISEFRTSKEKRPFFGA